MKKYKDLIIKFVCSIICIIIMSIIILNVYNYYSEKAKNKGSGNNNNQTEIKDKEKDKEKEQVKDISFQNFEFRKTYLDGFDTKVILDLENTDAGNILTINDNVVASYLITESISYGVLDDAIVIRIKNPDYGEHIVFSDKDGNVFKEFSLVNENTYNLHIMKSIMSDYEDAVVFKNNTFTITWRVLQDESNNIVLANDEILVVNNNIFLDKTYRKGDIVEYTLEIDYLGNKKFTEPNKVSEYNLEDYIKKFNK